MKQVEVGQAIPEDMGRSTSRNRVFVGPDGLRAGWSLLIWIAVMAAIGSLFMVLAQRLSHGYHPDPHAPQTPLFMFVGEFSGTFAVFLAAFIMSRIERRPFGAFGLRQTKGGLYFVLGAGCGLALLSVLVGALRVGGWLVFDGSAMSTAIALRYGLVWAGVFLCLGMFEETFVRGYVQFTLARGIGFWWAAGVLSTLFALAHKHNAGESPIGLLSAGLIGIVFCYSLKRTGSLWWAIGFHSAWDWGEAYLYGVPNSGSIIEGRLFSSHAQGNVLLSGGLTGPEGSILILLVIGIAFVLARSLAPNDTLAGTEH